MDPLTSGADRALVAVRRFVVTPQREGFLLPADTSPDWSLLAPITGAFTFGLSGTDRAQPIEGDCSVGELVLCPPRAELRRTMPSPMRFWYAEFALTDPEITPWWRSGKVSVTDRGRLRTNFQMLDELTSIARAPRRAHQAAHVLTDILLLLGREHRLSPRPANPIAVRAADRLDELALQPDLSIEALARELHVSPTQLTRRFREAHGVPPVRYVAEIRLARAQQLLVDTDESVTAIATQCGYHSPFYFSRAFRRMCGQSPSEFRASRRV